MHVQPIRSGFVHLTVLNRPSFHPYRAIHAAEKSHINIRTLPRINYCGALAAKITQVSHEPISLNLRLVVCPSRRFDRSNWNSGIHGRNNYSSP